MSRWLERAARAFALLGLAAAAGGAARADQESYLAPAELATASGAAIYSHVCQGCHMPEAQGAVGAGRYPKLAGDPKLASWEFAALTVVRGRSGMPAFGRRGSEPLAFLSARLDDEEIARVINYVRSHFGNHYPQTVSAADVAKIPHPGASAAP
jgi:mono/diheme cytochrome c family protein